MSDLLNAAHAVVDASSDAHEDYFTRNIVAVRAPEFRRLREALEASSADHPLAPAHLLNVLGRGDGSGPGVTPLDGDYPTVVVDELGAVAIRTNPKGELGIYLEISGRYNKREDRDERALLFAVGQAAELVAELAVAGEAGGPVFQRELLAAIDRKRKARGLKS